ncbi:PEP-CTERM sorting domain-containing protein [Crocosphaera watsonii]
MEGTELPSTPEPSSILSLGVLLGMGALLRKKQNKS